MIKRIFFSAIAIWVLNTATSFAQENSNQFTAVDAYVKSLGKLDSLNMGTISYIVTKKFTEPKDKVRAIFDWIAYNISYDCKAGRNSGNEVTGTEDIIKTRKAVASGYAALFQDMCSVIKIRCLTVDGYAKDKLEQINEKPDQFNHTWAVVQLGQSPDSWYYVDPTWGSGYTDEKVTTYTKKYNDAYFFANKTIFNFQHFPNNEAWLLGPGVKSLKDFFAAPLVKGNGYEFGISSYMPVTGSVKTTIKKPAQFSFRISAGEKVELVAIEIGTDKKKKLKTVDYTNSGSSISFSYKFEEEDSYPITIMVNNKPVLGYLVEVTE